MIKSICKIALLGLALCGAQNAHAEDTPPFKDAIDRFIKGYAIPVYGELQANTQQMNTAVIALCDNPGKEALTQAQNRFSDLLASWAAAELIRFGPIRAENRMERIFFWPDPRSRGLKQVQKLLYKTQQSSSAEPMNLRGKSVAAQGLSALEFVLFADDAAALTSVDTNRARCIYAKALTANLSEMANVVLAEWQETGTFAILMRNPGADNNIYRSEAEVFREILKSVSEALIITQQAKLQVGDTPEKPSPRKAPFSRSGETLNYLQAVMQNIMRLNKAVEFARMIPETEHGSVKQLVFELEQVNKTIEQLQNFQMSWATLVTSKNGFEKLTYVGIPINSVQEFYSETLPEQLGLSMGFNSLDGD